MITAILERVVLGAGAVVLVSVGVGSAFVPEAFYTDYGVDVSTVELANELRAAGMALLLLGLLVAAGAVWHRARFPAAVIAATVFLGYALGRGVSLLVDGAPEGSVLRAGFVEAALGLGAVWVALRARPRARGALGTEVGAGASAGAKDRNQVDVVGLVGRAGRPSA